MSGQRLREGFTTGSAAAAAAKACVLALCGERPTRVDIPLPGALGRLWVPVARTQVVEPHEALAEVIKDGGDDPDVTHGARIRCRLRLTPPDSEGAWPALLPVRIEGGEGIGRVTLPGLPVAVGQAAVNPAPRKQVAAAVAEALAERARPCSGVDLLLEIPGGHLLAAGTMNSRLGIQGGLSILGTSGIVRPFSHAAWHATVTAGLEVARAAGHTTVGLCTGRRSERLLRAQCPLLPDTACIQMADLFSQALTEAASRGFARIAIACYGGKLAKMAQGLDQTHAHNGSLDFAALARRCRALGLDDAAVTEVQRAVTVRRVLDLAAAGGLLQPLVRELAAEALQRARRHTGPAPELELWAFATDDTLLTSARLPAGCASSDHG